jgi:amino acid adenylation domain-containing protein
VKRPSDISRIASKLANPRNVSKAIESQKVRRREQEAYYAPENPTEETVAAIWSKLLSIDKVGRNDNFFQLGGHSLLATQMLARVRDSCGPELPLRAIFEAPVLAQFAGKIEASRLSGIAAERPVRCSRGATAPLSFAQQRLWFLDQLAPGVAFYNIPQRYRLRGILDREALQKALDEIVHRHESLRTTFTQVDSAPLQVISPVLKIPVRYVDLSHLEQGPRDAQAQRIMQDEAVAPFDLTVGPMLRALVIKLAGDEHELVFVTHHIVYDRWSHGILTEEIVAYYRAACERAGDPMPPLPIQYADYAIWQRHYLETGVLDKQIGYWKGRLAGAPTLSEFPTDHPRTAADQHRGAIIEQVLPPASVSRMRQICQDEGATLFMGLLAIFSLLLSRYSGLEDVVVGSPIANRNLTEIEPLIGFFVSTLALRTDLSGNPTFIELLRRVRETCLGAYANEAVPFERLVEELDPERSLSHNPIFQVAFAMQPAPVRVIELPQLRMERRPLHTNAAIFDVSWAAFDGPDGILLRVEYNTDLYDAPTIARTMQQFQHLLEDIQADPGKRIADLQLLDAKEEHTLLVDWNDTSAVYPRDRCVHEFFEEWAASAPDNLAVACGGDRLTYGALNRRANQVAHRLRRAGVGPESVVAVVLDRSPDLIVAILGILKAGGAYLPLDPENPAERLAFMIEDAQIAALLANAKSAPKLPPRYAAIRVDQDWEAFAGESDANPARLATPDNLAYVIYTSGSTGRPKGVEIGHRGLMNLCMWHRREYNVQPGDRATLIASPAFDASVWETWPYLSVGAALCVPGEEIRNSPAELLAWLERESISLTFLPTPLAEAVLGELRKTAWNGSSLRAMLTGGDKLHQCPDAALPFLLANHYGPTESTVVTTWTPVTPGGKEAPPIGRPIANTQVYVLNENLEPAPIGVAGELYIGGDGLARGYRNRPDATATSFVRNPFSTNPMARLYRTGDRVRFLADGNLEFLGRMDYQVKIRGFRIELGEIENSLNGHPAVQQSVVTAHEGGQGQKKLVAYYVAAAGQSVDVAELRSFLKQSLPDFMVPGAFVALQSFPLNTSGKVDRKALPAPEASDLRSSEYVAPRTSIEEQLASIWLEVLNVRQVGVHDDFFAVGGHSLLATQVISRIRQRLGAELPLRSLFESPTIAGLAARIESLKAGSAETTQIVRVPRDQPLPLSFAQERLWFLDQFEPLDSLYNITFAYRLRGELRISVLENSLSELVRRHEALRTGFTTLNGLPIQVIEPRVELPIVVMDVSGCEPGRREAEARLVFEREKSRPFDLRTAPLFRASVVKLELNDHVLVLAMHHIISDGWSFGILTKELAAIYGALCHGGQPALEDLPLQYPDYAAWQRQYLSGVRIEREIEYWRQELAGAPTVLAIPTDHPRPAVARHRGSVTDITLPEQLLATLAEMNQRDNVTLFMTLLAAFSVLLWRCSGQDDILVGSPVAGRTLIETENLVGLFLNTLVLRTRLTGGQTFRELLARVRDTTLAAFAHQSLPFEKLVEELHPVRDTSRNPLFQVMLTLQNQPDEGLNLEGLSASPFFAPGQTSKFDLTLMAVEKKGVGLAVSLEYDTDLFNAATAERMLGNFQTLLEAIAQDPSRSISELPLLTESEHSQLREWNATEREYPQCCLHEWFEMQAQRTPGATAVISGDLELTYAELSVRSNQLARHLQRLGAGPGVLIAICTERSPEMLVGLLGILKSGSAYLPIDHAYPRERIEFIIDDAQVPILVTQQSLTAMLPPFTGLKVCLDDALENIDSESREYPGGPSDPQQPAYVLYTSGSTGKPKGVRITHRNLVNFLASMKDRPGIDPGDLLLAVTTLSFDIAGLELYLPLIAGGTVLLASAEQARDGRELLAMMELRKPKILQATPATWWALLESGWMCSPDMKALCGGEALSADLAAQLIPRCKELWNMYGPTETTIWSTIFRVQEAPSGTVSIGKPIANTKMYVLDASFQPVPIGVIGELYIGGDGVARGYVNRPELDRARFLDDPFAAAGRMYRTGDMARFRRDGNLEYLGRTDDQVKVRGFRIELGEIESVLNRHRDVRQSVAVVRDGRAGQKEIAAYMVLQPGVAASATDLRQYVRAHLPEYMIPASFTFVDGFALTPNGKVDKKALPAPDVSSGEPEIGYVTPQTPIGEMVASIMAEVLRRDRVGADDSFFDMGGHSLSATQVVARARVAFGVELSVRALFEAPTSAALAGVIGRLERTKHGLEVPPIVRVSRDHVLPLSFAQQRLWFLDQMDPGNPLYNIPWAGRMTGDFDVEAMRIALNGLVQRHEILRTVYGVHEDLPFQRVLAEASIPMPIIDLSSIAAADREAEARRIVQEECARPFHLASEIQFRALVLKCDSREHIIVLNMHHIGSDGWSLGVMWADLSALYKAAVLKETAALPELPIQYADFAVWQRIWLQGETLERQLAFWKKQLDGAPPVLALPTDRPRQQVQSYRGAAWRVAMPENLTDGIRAISRQHSVTTFMSMLAAFQTLIFYYTRQPDLVLGTDLAGRTNVETEPLIGFFVNLMVVRTDLSNDPTFTALLDRVREVTLAVSAHQDLPFDKLVEELQPERSVNRSPLVQVLFVNLEAPRGSRTLLPGVELSGYPLDLPSKFDIVVFYSNQGTEITARWVYNPDLFDAATIERMAGELNTIVETVISNPGIKLSEILELLSANEQQRRTHEHKSFQTASLRKLKGIRRRSNVETGEAAR